MNGRSYFPQIINLSINDFSSAISYWFTVAKVSIGSWYVTYYDGEEIKIYSE